MYDEIPCICENKYGNDGTYLNFTYRKVHAEVQNLTHLSALANVKQFINYDVDTSKKAQGEIFAILLSLLNH